MKKARIFTILIAALALLPALKAPAEKELPKSELELGKMLFFDPILSLDQSISCASCHKPEFAFADTTAFSVGIGGARGTRNTPSAMNVASRPYLFWDGRSPSLENQALHPISNPKEMGLPVATAIQRLTENKFYYNAFQAIYGQAPSAELLGMAIGSFENSLETSDSPFDLFMRGDSSHISASAIRGRRLFVEKAGCFDCHFSPDFTGDEFKNIGLFNGKQYNDSGRYTITGNKEDIGLFRVPGLRNVALTAPYMHDGSFKTLQEVVEYYDHPLDFIPDAMGRDTTMRTALHLTNTEKADLVAFLESLTSMSLGK